MAETQPPPSPSKTEYIGKLLRDSLQSIATEAGFSLDKLVKQGVICADVEYGQEGYAFLPLNPPFLLLGETKEVSPDRERQLSEALGRFSEIPTVSVMRLRPIEFLRRISASQPIKAGIITWLNIFPDYLEYDDGGTLETFAKEAERLLIRGGMVIMSFTHHMENQNDQLRQCQIVIRDGIPGLQLSMLTKHASQMAGGLVLLGKKL